ncbi:MULTISPECIES: pantoate kinase [Haloferax]|uniref:Pantoate kinase n=1 Tax=Haloferax marinum TaxID=2666143 RepID=A0A6A8G7L5_9EURY|nr:MULTISPECIES: pantoate kinase [Haloferax]KAB1197096.1 sugar kinase [Haloferax sp. CBA1150]MRW96126.1 sugar kinase [Haloferax marinum]
MSDDATAFVPGHITGFFSAHPDDDPAVAGSRGAGVTLSHGVTVTVEPAAEAVVSLDGETVEMEPVVNVLQALGVTGAVTAESELPLGAGFGVSGAMALGTALAANAVFSCGHSENELVTVAHQAEVEAGTGLGDVVAQARGGMPIRIDPGAPSHGRMDGIPARPHIEYVTFGGLSTADILGGDTTTLTAAGETALDALVEKPTVERFLSESRQFARDATLLTDRVEAAIEDVRDVGGDAAMAMLGETVFAVGTGLSDAGYDPKQCRVHPAGATLQSE